MTPQRWQRISKVVAQALATPMERREAYLEDIFRAEPGLRSEVARLLANDEVNADSTFLQGSPINVQARLHQLLTSTDALVGSRVGPYHILKRIGEGGMGVVYLAEQEESLHRRVAFKIIKPGMDTKQTLARFEMEREALALMNHANVAKVFDAGATEQGRPYFVMEYVAGIPITEFCDKHRLGTEERLQLFMAVCHAIQHAHQKGIIHRDVNPGAAGLHVWGVPRIKKESFIVMSSRPTSWSRCRKTSRS